MWGGGLKVTKRSNPKIKAGRLTAYNLFLHSTSRQGSEDIPEKMSSATECDVAKPTQSSSVIYIQYPIHGCRYNGSNSQCYKVP
jgi:hypothetical protein